VLILSYLRFGRNDPDKAPVPNLSQQVCSEIVSLAVKCKNSAPYCRNLASDRILAQGILKMSIFLTIFLISENRNAFTQ
jgi:hypothetical protein